jgi:ureidoglycolate lyase
VPKGTLVVLRRGVWHHAPFAAGKSAVNAIIVLPERTYKNDCIVVDYSGEKSVEFAPV